MTYDHNDNLNTIKIELDFN